MLPEARVVYGTYGTLNAAGDNAVLLPSHYMADLTGYGFVIGPGKALDPTKLFLITTEMFGNGRSSSPSNTPEPLHGPRFPAITVRDDVAASHAVLDTLHVRHVKAVIGFSMGAEQAFQWAVSYPNFMDRIVATSGTARAWGHGIVRLEGQVAALTTDPAFKAGDYGSVEPDRGIQAFSLVWAGWLYSQEWWRRELWRGDTPPLANLPQAIDRYRHIFDGNDANDLILQARTWEAHDVGSTPGLAATRPRRCARSSARALYAVGDRPILPRGGRALRVRVHTHLSAEPDSVALGSSGRRGRNAGERRVHQQPSRANSWQAHSTRQMLPRRPVKPTDVW